MLRRFAICLLVTVAGAACVVAQDLGNTGASPATEPGDASPPATQDDGGSEAAPPGPVVDSGAFDAAFDGAVDDPTHGPGPYGALPGGYCCTDDSQCRMRHCASVGGAPRMCIDECSTGREFICNRPGVALTCEASAIASSGFACLPAPSPSATCLAPSSFVRGTKATGACCTYEESGAFGSECAGNLCAARGQGPWVCTNVCNGGGDCPGGYVCITVGARKQCYPGNSSYTCN